MRTSVTRDAPFVFGKATDLFRRVDAPAGVCFHRHRRGAGYVSQTVGLDVVLVRARPHACFLGHYHARVDAELSGVRCIGGEPRSPEFDRYFNDLPLAPGARATV